MEQRITLHIVDHDTRSRAEQARVVFALGHHAEVYADLDELLQRPPRDGVIVIRQRLLDNGLQPLMEQLADAGIWLPLVVSSTEPEPRRVVRAIKSGALDFLPLPLTEATLSRSIDQILCEAAAHSEARRKLIDARRRVGTLSRREREVLDWLTQGYSNKNIARELGISPRTVEIHRANMMGKLRASHTADAVRLRLEAGLDEFEDDFSESVAGQRQ